jgi:hypothetical protein
VLLATLHWQRGRRKEAVAVLEPALMLAEREGYVRAFVEADPAVIPVLRQAAVQGIAPETVGKLLAARLQSLRQTGRDPPHERRRARPRAGPVVTETPTSSPSIDRGFPTVAPKNDKPSECALRHM